ncbi:MAG: ATP-binding cassette domain-containing protein [Lachnospiraceae bacterium]
MKNIILETRAINKRYGNTNALENISISLYQGHIYGFIGENGAGKSTLLRIITGLSVPTSGEVFLFGKSNKSDLEAGRRQIGSTVEAPALYPDYSAEKNLELQRILVGNPDKGIIEKTLQLVGLSDCKTKKAKNFSTGMKQRLGIALSLVGNPQILILDEPINGLDPKGIADLRVVLQKLNAEHKLTILISSHILNELHLLATDYIIINKGKIIEDISHEELEQKCQKYISIKMDNVEVGVTALDQELHTDNYKVMGDGTVHLYDYTNNIPIVAEALRKHNILVTHISLTEQTLEEYYFSITGGKERE